MVIEIHGRDVLHLLVLDDGIEQALLQFEEVRCRLEAVGRQLRRLDAIHGGLAGMKGLGHGPEVGHQAAGHAGRQSQGVGQGAF